MNKQEFPALTETKTRERYFDGRAEKVAEGILKAYIDMVKDKLISIAEVAKKVGMPEDKF